MCVCVCAPFASWPAYFSVMASHMTRMHRHVSTSWNICVTHPVATSHTMPPHMISRSYSSYRIASHRITSHHKSRKSHLWLLPSVFEMRPNLDNYTAHMYTSVVCACAVSVAAAAVACCFALLLCCVLPTPSYVVLPSTADVLPHWSTRRHSNRD